MSFLQLNNLNAIQAVMDTYKLELFVQAFAYVICLTSRSVMAYSNRRLFLTNSDCIVRNYDMAKSIFAYLFIQMIWLFLQKRKTVRARRKRKEMIKNFVNFLLSPNLVISYYIYQIRHLIIISALEIKQEEIDCVSSKKTPIQRAKCQTNPYQKRPNIR